MSVLVMGLCFRAKFGNPYLKAVAVALADHASDDGSKIWPSVATIADKTEIAERTVQYKLLDLESMGLIICVDEGGKGAKDTREYRFDMGLLRQLSDGELAVCAVDKGALDAPTKGASDAPMRLVRVQLTTGRVHPTTDNGAPGAPEPSLTIIEPSFRAPARDEQIQNLDSKKDAPATRVFPTIAVSRADLSWSAWMEFLRENHPELAERAEHHGLIKAAGRWPRPGLPAPVVDAKPRNVTGDKPEDDHV